MWDFGTGKLVETVPWEGDGNLRSRTLCLSATFNKLDHKDIFAVGGSGNCEVRLFDFKKDNAPFASITDFDQTPVFATDFAEDNSRLLCGGKDGLVRIYSLSKRK